MLENGYGICSNAWLFDNDIKNELRILLYISSLCAEKGYCWAGNEHFAEKFNESTENISRKIKKLERKKLLFCEYKRNGGIVIKRTIRLINLSMGDGQIYQSAIDKNIKDNIINNNITNKLISKPQTTFEEDSFEYVLCKKFLQEQINNKNTSTIYLYKTKGDEIIQSWCKIVEMMRKTDKYPDEIIEKVVMFATEDSFWKENVGSMEKFRKKDKSKVPYFIVLANKAKIDMQKNEDNNYSIKEVF